MAEVCSDGSEYYELVRRSDGASVCSFKLRLGDRVLIYSASTLVGHKRLQVDERVISRETLVEIVKELSTRN